MLPTKAVRKQLGELLAADTGTLAPATLANKVALVMAAFTPEENMVPADLVLATFDGSTALNAGTGTQPCGVDPATGQQIVTIKEPAGGWRWETSGVTHLPQTIYGYALLNNDSSALLGIAVLPAPLTLQEIGQEIQIGNVTMTIVDAPMS